MPTLLKSKDANKNIFNQVSTGAGSASIGARNTTAKVLKSKNTPIFKPQPFIGAPTNKTVSIENQDNKQYTIADLGARVRQRNPDAFSGFTDEQIGERILARKPDLKNIIKVEQPIQNQDKKLSWKDQLKSMNPGQMAIGGLKGLGSTALSLGQLGSGIMEAGYNATIGKLTGKNALKSADATQQVKDSRYFKPQNAGQYLGYGTEQLLEFFVPAGKVSKGTKAVQGLTAASKFSPLLKSGVNLAAKAALEGTAAAGVTAAQQGKIDKNVAVNALLGAGGEVAGKGLSALGKTLSPTLKSSALKSYTKALNPTTKENKAITQRIVPELIDRGTIGLSRQGLLNSVAKRVDKANKEMDMVLEGIPKDTPVNLAKVIDELENAKQSFLVKGANGEMIAADPQAIQHIEGFQKIISDIGVDSAPYESVRKLRQIWDKSIADSKGFYGKTLTEGSLLDAKKEAADALRKELAQEFPDMDKVNKEFSFWANAQKVLGDTIERTQGHQRPLTETIRRGAGAVIGGTIGGGAGALIGDIALGGLTKLVDSTAWRTLSAIQKNKIAELLATGETKQAIDLIIRILEAQNVNK